LLCTAYKSYDHGTFTASVTARMFGGVSCDRMSLICFLVGPRAVAISRTTHTRRLDLTRRDDGGRACCDWTTMDHTTASGVSNSCRSTITIRRNLFIRLLPRSRHFALFPRRQYSGIDEPLSATPVRVMIPSWCLLNLSVKTCREMIWRTRLGSEIRAIDRLHR